METNNNNPLHKRQGKDSHFQTQLQKVFNYLENHIATASMVEEATGIKQKNICRFKRTLEVSGLLWQIEKKKCKTTGYTAWYITTNPEYSPKYKQLSLF